MGAKRGRDGRNSWGSEEPDAQTEPEKLPSPPAGVSRVDTLPEDFVATLSHRPHLPGDVLGGRFKLIDSLGDGAMGQVFVAENLAIGRPVAIKILKPDLLADPSFRKRFQQEAMATAAVVHRNVARFIDLVVGDPTFLVMEYVPGPTLAKVLREERRLDWQRAVRLGIRLCWALDAAHRHGIIHRDIKPANIILAPDPESGEEPKLIDFGLAKLPTLVGAESLTRTGQIVGTPRYMSPEQVANRDVDARSDVYALGCVLYQMLNGTPPFHEGDDVQVLYKQLQENAPPLPTLPGAPPELAAAIARSLAKSPEQRFPSMREFAQALSACQPLPGIGSAIIAPEERREAVGHGRPRSSRWWWLVVCLAFVTGGVAGVGSPALERRREAGGSALFITSHPPHASLFVDGKRLADVAPAALPALASGQHQVRAELPGRDPVEQTVALGQNERAALDLVLPPASRQVEIRSVPSGATIFVDDSQVPGETPLTVSLTDGDFHDVRAERLGYEPARHPITPDDHASTITLPLDLERLPRGRLLVDADDGGEVFVDGGDTGFRTPTIAMMVKAGEHNVEMKDPASGRSATTTVDVRQGETLRIRLHYPENQP